MTYKPQPETKKALSVFLGRNVGVVLDNDFVIWGYIKNIMDYGIVVIDKKDKTHYISYKRLKEITDTYRSD